VILSKNRPRHTNDNALVESKNGWVIRKFMGYSYIDQRFAARVNDFYFRYFNDYLNYHRSCAFPTEIADRKGKIRKVYRQKDYTTPYEKLKSIPDAWQYLKEGITFETLDRKAYRYSDNEYAKMMQEERSRLFKQILLPDLSMKAV